MNKFVIQYNTGSYDSYNEHVYTLEAESKESITETINEAIVGFVAHNKRVVDFMETRPCNLMGMKDGYNHPAVVEWYKEREKFVKCHGSILYNLCVFGGKLPIKTTNGSTIEELFDNFMIYDLDEWFEERKIENN